MSWQGRAWVEERLSFPSPWEHGELQTQLSVRRLLVFGYVLQQGDQRALVLPGWLGGGHEIEAVYLLREQVLLLLPCSLAPERWFLLALAELLPLVVTTTPWPAVLDGARQRRLFLEGHPNFAHQLLNVLSALEPLPAEIARLHWVGQEPFGPIDRLYPERTWTHDDDTATLGEVFELPLSQRPDWLPSTMRQRIRSYCEAQMSPAARELLTELVGWRAAGGRVLWVSLRTQGAWAEGLPALVGAWMDAMAAQGEPLPLVLLDGFSLQSGDSETSQHYGTSVAMLLEEERQQAAEMRAALAHLEITLREAIGLSLSDAIALGGAVDSYLCHQGTVQHKLGWCQEVVPGVVHSSSWRSREGSHPWGGLGGAEPLWLPTEFSEDLEEGPRAAYRFLPERLGDAAAWLAGQRLWRTDG